MKVPRERRADCLFLPSSCIVSLISLDVCYLIQGATRAIPEKLGFQTCSQHLYRDSVFWFCLAQTNVSVNVVTFSWRCFLTFLRAADISFQMFSFAVWARLQLQFAVRFSGDALKQATACEIDPIAWRVTLLWTMFLPWKHLLAYYCRCYDMQYVENDHIIKYSGKVKNPLCVKWFCFIWQGTSSHVFLTNHWQKRIPWNTQAHVVECVCVCVPHLKSKSIPKCSFIW